MGDEKNKDVQAQLSLVPGEAMAAPGSLSRLASLCGLRAGPGLSPRSPVRVQRIPSQVCSLWGLSRAGALLSPGQLACHRQRGQGLCSHGLSRGFSALLCHAVAFR